KVSTPSRTEKALADLHSGLNAAVDIVALSFVRTADDVQQLRDHLGGRPVSIVAKIEKPEAYDNIEPILDVTDGVMVARGDLGVEISLERVPRIQKSIIRRARRKGRFVITATQMLESMIENPRPTRAEVSDVANAIYDGTDAVMLSAETSVGKYPVESVEFMARIAVETEASIRNRGYQEPQTGPEPSNPEIVADAAYRAAREAKASAVVVFTASGSSARLVSRYRPPVPIYAFPRNFQSAWIMRSACGTIELGAKAMAILTIEVPDELARSLEGMAAAQHKSVQQLAIERLSSLVEAGGGHLTGSPAAVLRAMQ